MSYPFIPYTNEFYETYKMNIFSQNGEDGVIQEILKRLNITVGTCVEFGAWDGKHLSNTFHLVKNHGWNAIYIEGDAQKYQDLLKTCQEYPTITPIQAFVDHNNYPGNHNTLDNILSRTDIPSSFDIISIDIDSFDYQVWKSLSNYTPKIVIIEIHSGIKPYVTDHIHTPGRFDGTSFFPMLQLGIEKGYQLVCHTGNMIFIRDDLYKLIELQNCHPFSLFRRDWINRWSE